MLRPSAVYAAVCDLFVGDLISDKLESLRYGHSSLTLRAGKLLLRVNVVYRPTGWKARSAVLSSIVYPAVCRPRSKSLK